MVIPIFIFLFIERMVAAVGFRAIGRVAYSAKFFHLRLIVEGVQGCKFGVGLASVLPCLNVSRHGKLT